jgi:cobalt-zinc-cadmium efflux system outer membrane protein
LNAQKTSQAAGFRVEQARSLLRQAVGGALPADFALSGNLGDVPEVPPLDGLRQQLTGKQPRFGALRRRTGARPAATRARARVALARHLP